MHVWHQVKIVAEGNQIQFYVDKALIETIKDDRHLSGGIAFDVVNGHIHLDDIVVEGPDIPNGTPEATFLWSVSENCLRHGAELKKIENEKTGKSVKPSRDSEDSLSAKKIGLLLYFILIYQSQITKVKIKNNSSYCTQLPAD